MVSQKNRTRLSDSTAGLIYNAMSISAVQQSDSVIYVCVHSFLYSFPLWFIPGYWTCAIQSHTTERLNSKTVGLCCLSIL